MIVTRFFNLLDKYTDSSNVLALQIKNLIISMGEKNIEIYFFLIACAMWLSFIFVYLGIPFLKAIKSGNSTGFSLEKLQKTLVLTIIIFFVFASGGWLSIIEFILRVTVSDGFSHRGLYFTVSYDKNNPLYGMYELVTILLVLFTGLMSVIYYFKVYIRGCGFEGVEDGDDGEAEPTKNKFWFGVFRKAFLFCVLMFFTIMPEYLLNKFVYVPNTGKTISEYIMSSKTK